MELRIVLFSLLIQISWSFYIPNQVFERDGFEMSLQSTPTYEDVELVIVAPFYGSRRPNARNGSLASFGPRERMQLVLQHPNDEFVDVQIGPYGHHQMSLFSNNRRIRYSLPTRLQTWIDGPVWTGRLVIPMSYLPAEPSGITAFGIRQDGPQRRTWSMNALPEEERDLDVHHPGLFTPVRVARADSGPQRVAPNRLWPYARRGILAYDVDDDFDDIDDEDDYVMTFQGFQKGVECNMSVPMNRHGKPAKAAHVVFKNDEGQATELELTPHGKVNMRTYVGPNQEVPNDIPEIDYIAKNDGNTWDGSVLIPPEYFPPQSDEVNVFVDYDDDGGQRRNTRHWTEPDDPEDQIDDDKFDPRRFRKFERDLLLVDNESPSPFWQNLLKKQPKPDPIFRNEVPEVTDNVEEPTEESSIEVHSPPRNRVQSPARSETPRDPERSNETPEAPSEERVPNSKNREERPTETHNENAPNVPSRDGELDEAPEETEDRPVSRRGGEPEREVPRDPQRNRPQEEESRREQEIPDRRRKINLDSEPNIPVYRSRLSKKIPSDPENSENFRHPYEEREHKNSFKVIINPQLKEGKANPEIIVEEVFPENEEPPQNQDESDFIKLKILDDDAKPASRPTKPNKRERKIDSNPLEQRTPPEEKPKSSPVTNSPASDSVEPTNPDANETTEPMTTSTDTPTTPSAKEDPKNGNNDEKSKPEEPAKETPSVNKPSVSLLEAEDMILDFLMEKLAEQEPSLPKENPELEGAETPAVVDPDFPNSENQPREGPMEDPMEILDSLTAEDNLFPPPHPICFEEGLVEDQNRCEVFYECVLENNEWQMFSWMCKPGTIFDPERLACLAGTCV